MIRELPDHCIEWPGKRDRDGYGCLMLAGERRAHRAMYRLLVGPIPDGLHVLHGCDNPACVNPRHLRLGQPLDNAADRSARRRSPQGCARENAKLDPVALAQIRSGALSQHEATAKYGIGKSAFYRARSGESYRNT